MYMPHASNDITGGPVEHTGCPASSVPTQLKCIVLRIPSVYRDPLVKEHFSLSVEIVVISNQQVNKR